MNTPLATAARDDQFADLLNWIIQCGVSETTLEELLDGFCERVRAEGVPILRVAIAMPMVDPTFRAISIIWRRGSGSVLEQTRHGKKGEAEFAASPIAYLVEQDRTTARYRLSEGEGTDRFPLLERLRDAGGTDYYMRLLRYPAEYALTGAAFSMTSDAADGFAQADIDRIERLLPALALTAYRIALTRFSRQVLGFYLGTRTGARVLAGEIRRGSGETMRAALFFADVRSFTMISGLADSSTIVGWLNGVFERLGGAIEDQGGEILKFIGDGVLAIFPLLQSDQDENEACERALAAATTALTGIDALVAEHRQADLPVLEIDVALHFGDVYYGNIGAARRLDFTAIGSAVNEVARMEKLCDALGVHILASEAFAKRLSLALTPLGSFELRGVAEPFAVYSLPGEG